MPEKKTQPEPAASSETTPETTPETGPETTPETRAKISPIDAFTRVVSLVCVLILGAMFIAWGARTDAGGALPMLSALLCAALFGALGLRFLPVWFGDWYDRAGRTHAALPDRARPGGGTIAKVFFTCLGAILAAHALLYLWQLMTVGRVTIPEALQLWTRLDSQHYISIARDWYASDGDESRVVLLVFLPGYPLLIRLFAALTRDWFASALLVSALSFAGAGVVVYLLAREDGDHDYALRALKYTIILPGAVFYAAPMTESLFLLLSVSCVYFARRRRFAAAGLMGGLAAFTRSVGLVLLAPLCYELIADALERRPSGMGGRERGRLALSAAAVLLVPAGFGAYCLVCRAVSGDPFRFLVYQREHWNQSLGYFFNTAAYQMNYAAIAWQDGDMERLFGLRLPNLLCIFGSLALMTAAARRLRPSYTAYFIGYFVVAIGTTWLLSGPRYLSVVFPLSFAVAGYTESRRADNAVTIAFTVLYVLYMYVLVMRWQVW